MQQLEILRVLGEGGHSQVFLARRSGGHGFQRLIAIKVIRRDAGLPISVADRFVHEARLLGLLRHRNIVVADDVVDLERGTAILMEYVPGANLSDFVRLQGVRPGVVPLGFLAYVGFEVCSALMAAWKSPNPFSGVPLHVLHCDIKPSNVRVTADGTVKLLDFGVASSHIEGSMDGPLMGTLAYVAPERIEDGTTTPASDIFSLGLTLLAIAQGKLMKGRPLAPDGFAAWASNAIAALPEAYAPLAPVLKAMVAIDPLDRPGHADTRAQLYEISRLHSTVPHSDVAVDLLDQIAQSSHSEPSRSSATPPPVVEPTPPILDLPPEAWEELSSALADGEALEVSVATLDVPQVPPAPVRQLGPGRREAPQPNAGVGARGGRSAPVEVSSSADTHVFAAPPPPRDMDGRAGLRQLLMGWFEGGRAVGIGALSDPTLLHPSPRLLAPVAAFADWFPLDIAMTLFSRNPGGPGFDRADLILDRLLQLGWLEASRQGGVAAVRIRSNIRPSVQQSLDELPERSRHAYCHAALRSWLDTIDDTTLLDLHLGTQRALVLPQCLAADLARHSADLSGVLRILAAVFCAVVADRMGAPRAVVLERLREEVDNTVEDVDALRARRWLGYLWRTDPWASMLAPPAAVKVQRSRAFSSGDPLTGAGLALEEAQCLRLTGQLDEAHRVLANVISFAAKRQMPALGTLAQLEQARVFRRQDDPASARRVAVRCIRTADLYGLTVLWVDAWLEYAASVREMGDADDCEMALARALFLADESGVNELRSRVLVERGISAWVDEDIDSALRDLHDAAAAIRPDHVGRLTWCQAWLAGALFEHRLLDDCQARLRPLDPSTDGLPDEVAIVVHAWEARLAAFRRESVTANVCIRRAIGLAERLHHALPRTTRQLLSAASHGASETEVHTRTPPRVDPL